MIRAHISCADPRSRKNGPSLAVLSLSGPRWSIWTGPSQPARDAISAYTYGQAVARLPRGGIVSRASLFHHLICAGRHLLHRTHGPRDQRPVRVPSFSHSDHLQNLFQSLLFVFYTEGEVAYLFLLVWAVSLSTTGVSYLGT